MVLAIEMIGWITLRTLLIGVTHLERVVLANLLSSFKFDKLQLPKVETLTLHLWYDIIR